MEKRNNQLCGWFIELWSYNVEQISNIQASCIVENLPVEVGPYVSCFTTWVEKENGSRANFS